MNTCQLRKLCLSYRTANSFTRSEFSSKARPIKAKDEKSVLQEKMYEFYTTAVAASKVKATFPPEVMEEHARIAKEYNRQYFIRTNRLKHDIANKIWMKNEAYKALPAELQPAANKPDLNHKPRDAPTPPLYFTPPIKGFDVKKYVSNSEDSNTDDEDFNQ